MKGKQRARGVLYAEDFNYWKTGQSSPDRWMERSKALILSHGGKGVKEGFLSGGEKAFYILSFELQGHTFRAIWPVLPTLEGNEYAAKVQAATALHHEIKARLLAAKVVGAVEAMLSWKLLADGRSAGEVAKAEPHQLKNLLQETFYPQLPAGDAGEN